MKLLSWSLLLVMFSVQSLPRWSRFWRGLKTLKSRGRVLILDAEFANWLVQCSRKSKQKGNIIRKKKFRNSYSWGSQTLLLTLSLPSEAACCLDSSAHRTFFLSILAVGENKHRTDSLEGVKHALYLFPPPPNIIGCHVVNCSGKANEMLKELMGGGGGG